MSRPTVVSLLAPVAVLAAWLVQPPRSLEDSTQLLLGVSLLLAWVIFINKVSGCRNHELHGRLLFFIIILLLATFMRFGMLYLL